MADMQNSNKERRLKMNNQPKIQSLSEYKRGSSQAASSIVEINKISTDNSSIQVQTLSPLKSGNAALVNSTSRNKILSFAHPVDAAIIKALDNPMINTVFNKIVQTSIDATWGLSLATGIHVSPNTYPEIYKIVVECADSLGIPIPYVIISDQVKGINACTAGTDQFSFIAISSMLPLVLNLEEMKFVIGHECGHLALGHVVYHTAINMVGSVGGLLPVVGDFISKTITYPLNAWSRRSEISADRAGLICCGDIGIAARSLFKLEAGFLNIDEIDIDAYIDESENVLKNTALGKYSEITMSHPIIPKRIKALKLFYNSTVYTNASGIISEPSNTLLTAERLSAETEKIIEIM
ncbi:MAG: M48 family metallopeptidase [Candidatus Gastranaerophilaceae bacterium]